MPDHKRKILLVFSGRIFRFIVVAVCLFFAIWYLYTHKTELAFLVSINLKTIVLLAAVLLISYICVAQTNILIMRVSAIFMNLGESYFLSLVTGFYNLITPFRGGMAVRAVYLKKKYDFSYTDFLATLAASYIIIFFASSLLGLISTFIIYEQTGVFSWILALVFAGAFFPMLGIMIFAPKLRESKHRWFGKVVRVINGWHLIRKNKKVVFSILVLSIIQVLLSAWMNQLQFAVFGLHISFVKALFLASIGSLSILIAITPAGLGINEAVAVFSGLTIGITAAQSLSAAILGRLVSVVVLFTLGPIFSWWLLKRPQKSTKLAPKKEGR